MLVLSRRENERVQITTSDGVITVVVVELRRYRDGGTKIRLGFEAPETVEVIREELLTGFCRKCGAKTSDHQVQLLDGRMRRVCPVVVEQRASRATAEETT